jgi:UPF0176 protein
MHSGEIPASAGILAIRSKISAGMTYTIAALYRFVALPNAAELREQLRAAFSPGEASGSQADLCGTLILAPEGINGTLAGSSDTIDRLLTLLAETTGLDRSAVKISTTEDRPFGRLKFQLKREIIAFRKAVIDPTQAGQTVDPAQWNDLIADPAVLLLDTRNQYETELGTFAGAVDPHIETFSDFVTWVREHLDPAKTPKVAMYCTGGIRCEKASAFMLQEGFSDVFHLKGGILKYLEEIPTTSSKWQGECFVFDRRTSVGHADYEE